MLFMFCLDFILTHLSFFCPSLYYVSHVNQMSDFLAPHFTLVKEALIEIGCVVTSLVVGWLVIGRWLSRACTVAKRCILGL